MASGIFTSRYVKYALMLIVTTAFMGCDDVATERQNVSTATSYAVPSISEVSTIFKNSPPVKGASDWSMVNRDDSNIVFQKSVSFFGNDDITISIFANILNGAEQRRSYNDLRKAVNDGHFILSEHTAFELTALDGGKNTFRYYFIGSQISGMICTYEGIGAPFPFVRCSWSDESNRYFVESPPIAIHYILSSRQQIERLVAISNQKMMQK